MAIGQGHNNVLLSAHLLHYFISFVCLNNAEFTFLKKFSWYIVWFSRNIGSENCWHHNARDIEAVHTKCLRRILCVKQSTYLSAPYCETGRFPFEITRKYCMKILSQNTNYLILQTFLMLKQDTDFYRHDARNNLAYMIKTILDIHGFSYIWDNKFEIDIPFDEIKKIIDDSYRGNL
jgi:hypothetical protein